MGVFTQLALSNRKLPVVLDGLVPTCQEARLVRVKNTRKLTFSHIILFPPLKMTVLYPKRTRNFSDVILSGSKLCHILKHVPLILLMFKLFSSQLNPVDNPLVMWNSNLQYTRSNKRQ